MLVLAFDTATPAVTVAVGNPGQRLSGPAVAAPATLPAGLPVAGERAHVYQGQLGAPIPPRYPAAATAAVLCAKRLAAGDSLPPPEPLYLHRPDARVPGPPKSVLPAPSGVVSS